MLTLFIFNISVLIEPNSFSPHVFLKYSNRSNNVPTITNAPNIDVIVNMTIAPVKCEGIASGVQEKNETTP